MALLVCGLLSTAGRAQTYTTTFEGEENPLSENGKWINNGLDWTKIRKKDGLAFGTETGLNHGPAQYDDSYAHLSGFPPDQEAWGEVVIAKPDSSCNQEVEILLRWTSSEHSTTGYECLVRCLSGDSSYMEIVRWEGPLGKFTYLTQHQKRGAEYGLKNGDILKASIVGNVITMYVNGVEKARVVDDTHKTGDPGIGMYLYCHGGKGYQTNGDFGFQNFTARAIEGTKEAPKAKQSEPKPVLPPGTQVHSDLEYVAGGHARNKLDLYLPAKADRPLPVIVWIHGGGWENGSKDRPPAIPFIAQGYAVASINYRLSQHAVFPAQIEDCKAAIRWLRASAKEYGLDAAHVGVWGASAGGHLVALLGTSGGVKELEGNGGNLDQSSRVQCVVDFYGPTDFAKMGGWQDKPDSPMAKLVGGPVREKQELAAKANPITYVSKDAAPFLIMHGEEDKTVPMNQSDLLDEALRKAGVESTFVRIPGNGHGGPGFSNPENRKRIADFFEKHLK